MDISVVIPVYNEAESIGPLLAEVAAALDEDCDYEVICVDDASTDGTPRVLAAWGNHSPCVRVVRHTTRCGQTSGLVTGARSARSQWIVTLDGDGQNDPADIPGLLSVLERADRPPRLELVAGVRVKRHDPWLKRFSSRVANRVRASILGDDIPDTGCGLKLIDREALLSLPFFDHMHRFLPALILRGGGAVMTFEVSHRPRLYGRSKYGLHDRLWTGIADIAGVLWLQRRMKTPRAEEMVTHE